MDYFQEEIISKYYDVIYSKGDYNIIRSLKKYFLIMKMKIK